MEHVHIHRVLHKAELNKEKVLIIGHIPPGIDGCYSESCMQEQSSKKLLA